MTDSKLVAVVKRFVLRIVSSRSVEFIRLELRIESFEQTVLGFSKSTFDFLSNWLVAVVLNINQANSKVSGSFITWLFQNMEIQKSSSDNRITNQNWKEQEIGR